MVAPEYAKAKLKHCQREKLNTVKEYLGADWKDDYFESIPEALMAAKEMLDDPERQPWVVYAGPFSEIGLTVHGHDQRLWHKADHEPEVLDTLLQQHGGAPQSQAKAEYAGWGEF